MNLYNYFKPDHGVRQREVGIKGEGEVGSRPLGSKRGEECVGEMISVERERKSYLEEKGGKGGQLV